MSGHDYVREALAAAARLAGSLTIVPQPARDNRHRPPPGDEDNPLTEDALALRFSARHEHDLRYVATKGQWLKWDGGRWCPEPRCSHSISPAIAAAPMSGNTAMENRHRAF